MILGQSAATAAVQAIKLNTDLQSLPFAGLREQLLKDGQVLDLPPQTPQKELIMKGGLKGIVLDDSDATLIGVWTHSASAGKFVGVDYIHDSDAEKGEKSVSWKLVSPGDGRFELRISYTENPNRATNVPVTITVNGQSMTQTINQKERAKIDGMFHSLGFFELNGKDEITVLISNKDTDGHVIADAVQLLPASQ